MLTVCVIVLAVFLPFAWSARKRSRLVACDNQMRVIGKAIEVYSQQYSGYLIPSNPRFRPPWPALLVGEKYLLDSGCFKCPGDPGKGTLSYRYNRGRWLENDADSGCENDWSVRRHCVRLDRIARRSQTILMGEDHRNTLFWDQGYDHTMPVDVAIGIGEFLEEEREDLTVRPIHIMNGSPKMNYLFADGRVSLMDWPQMARRFYYYPLSR